MKTIKIEPIRRELALRLIGDMQHPESTFVLHGHAGLLTEDGKVLVVFDGNTIGERLAQSEKKEKQLRERDEQVRARMEAGK